MPRLSLEFQYDRENACTIKTVNNMDIVTGNVSFSRDLVLQNDVMYSGVSDQDGTIYPGYISIGFHYLKKEDGNDKLVNEFVYTKIYVTPGMLECIDVLDDVIMSGVYKTLYKIYIVRRFADLNVLEMKNPSPHNIETNFTPFMNYIKEELYREVSGAF